MNQQISTIARDIYAKSFRGEVLGQQSCFIDKTKLIADSRDFDTQQFIEDSQKMHEHVLKHGPMKF